VSYNIKKKKSWHYTKIVYFISAEKKYFSHKVFTAVHFSSLFQTANNNNVGQYSKTILNTVYILSFIHMLKSHDQVF
jgi:hypothetical protein